jgi:anti-anti-sigma factor
MISERGKDPKMLNIVLRGELDGVSAGRFGAEIEAAIAQGVIDVFIDCRELVFVDSRGIGALLDIRKSLEALGGVMVLFSPMNSFRQTLAVTGLDRTLLVVDA